MESVSIINASVKRISFMLTVVLSIVLTIVQVMESAIKVTANAFLDSMEMDVNF